MKFDFHKKLKKIIKKKKSETDEADKREGSPENDYTGAEKEGIFSKIGNFFDPEPQKEKVLRREDFNAAGDVYYASVSAFYKVAERLLWVILSVFLAVSIASNYSEITYDNFFYLLKDFSSAADSTNTSNYQILSYDSDSRQKFSIYRGGLVSVSPSAVSVFTASGRRTLKNSTGYYSPYVVCSDKYALVYDMAGGSFSVYNSFAKVYSESFEGIITDANFAADGSFAITTRESESKTVIYLYGKNLKKRGVCTLNRYVFDVALDSDKERMTVLSYNAGIGTGSTGVTVFDISSEKSARSIYDIEIAGEFPLGCTVLEKGTAILTNRSARIYNDSMAETQNQGFLDFTVSAFDLNESGLAAAISSGTQKRIIAFDKTGKMLYNDNIAEIASDIGINGEYIFIRTVSGVTRLDTETGERESLPSDSGEMLVYSADTVMVCGEAKAEYLVFGKNN